MKSVLVSEKPIMCDKIANGKKTIIVKKKVPKEVPFKCYIYCCKAKSKWSLCDYEGAYENSKGEIVYAQQHIIGEFICDKVDKITTLQHTYYNFLGAPIATITEYGIWNDDLPQMCLTKKEIEDYGKGETLYGWHISDLKIYDKPRELSEFGRPCSYSGPCFCCKRASVEKDGNLFCNAKIIRPPQSYMYVEDLGVNYDYKM